MSLLELKDLSIDFGSRRVVHQASFTLDAGEKLALVGESASGKTVTALSTLRLIENARLSGQIIFNGESVLSMSAHELHQLRGRDIAVIFQEPMTALNPIHTVGDQIVESLVLHTHLRGGAAWAEAVEALETHSWPGNVRELDHTLERAVLLAQGGAIRGVDLGLRPVPGASPRLEDLPLEEVERLLIRKALERHDGNVSQAAKALGLS